MAVDRVHLFGIRHHGPGSGYALERALDALNPESVLIEGPPEADPLIPFVAKATMRPPVALLLHSKDDPTVASFYPFPDFSPEWRAMRWALAHQRAVRFIDLPIAYRLAERAAAKEAPEAESAEPGAPRPEPVRVDPLSRLAEVAGYDDAESWWNALIEQQPNHLGVFPAIEEAMTAVRATTAPDDDPVEAAWEARREAHMRECVRTALKESSGEIAVVTGAWHVPALREAVTAAADREQLRGLKKIPVVATWVPWTDRRLAVSSGYGAGVISPGWYRHVAAEMRRPRGEGRLDAVGHGARWQARAAALLRSEGIAVPPSSVIEATRLGIALATLRDHPLPGLGELRDAALATLCGGEPVPLQLIERRLVIGQDVGEVDPDVPQMPLLADLVRWQKRLRLEPKALDEEISIDLRTETGLAKSTLLRRLDIIAVPWGRLLDAGRSRGTFRERWTICWDPEFAVRLAEALRWGSTIEQAASAAVVELGHQSTAIAEVATMVNRALLADLGPAAEVAMSRLQELAAQSGDVARLMDAVPPLAETLRYGTARQLPEAALNRLVETLIVEIAVGLPLACRQLDDDQAEAMASSIGVVDRSVSLLERDDLQSQWDTALAAVAGDDAASAQPRGAALRRRYDRGQVQPAELERAIGRALSPAVPPNEAGGWTAGFLGDSGQLLIHDDVLFGGLDGWLMALDEPTFTTVLPLVRRGFGALDQAERRRLLDGVRHGRGGSRVVAPAADVESAGFVAALPLLKTILGLR